MQSYFSAGEGGENRGEWETFTKTRGEKGRKEIKSYNLSYQKQNFFSTHNRRVAVQSGKLISHPFAMLWVDHFWTRVKQTKRMTTAMTVAQLTFSFPLSISIPSLCPPRKAFFRVIASLGRGAINLFPIPIGRCSVNASS